MKRKEKVLAQITLAQVCAGGGDAERTEQALNNAILLLRGEKPTLGLTLYELNQACDAFLEESKFPTLAVALVYIEHYRKKAALAHVERCRPGPDHEQG